MSCGAGCTGGAGLVAELGWVGCGIAGVVGADLGTTGGIVLAVVSGSASEAEVFAEAVRKGREDW